MRPALVHSVCIPIYWHQCLGLYRHWHVTFASACATLGTSRHLITAPPPCIAAIAGLPAAARVELTIAPLNIPPLLSPASAWRSALAQPELVRREVAAARALLLQAAATQAEQWQQAQAQQQQRAASAAAAAATAGVPGHAAIGFAALTCAVSPLAGSRYRPPRAPAAAQRVGAAQEGPLMGRLPASGDIAGAAAAGLQPAALFRQQSEQQRKQQQHPAVVSAFGGGISGAIAIASFAAVLTRLPGPTQPLYAFNAHARRLLCSP